MAEAYHTALIPLTQDKLAIVDFEDYHWLSQWSWHATQRNDKKFVAARKPKTGIIRMHRLIAGAPKGLLVDHRDGNPLNNRRSNLRLCTHCQSQCNTSSRRNSTSSYKGVSFCNIRKKWVAQIRANGLYMQLGRHETEMAAALAYDIAARRLHGDFAKPNFIHPDHIQLAEYPPDGITIKA